jgi:ferredoxin-like protein FixX
VPYHLWVRAKSQNEHYANDSVWVQFSGATSYKIGTTSATMVNLEDCSGCGTSGWGWQDNGYGTGVSGPHISFTSSGTQTIRLQTREDGMFIDQIVLSPQNYLTTSPGALKNDTTILPPSGGNLPPPDTTDPTAVINSPAPDATVGGTVTVSVSASDNVGIARVDLLVDSVVIGTDTAAPFSFSWNTTGASQGAHALQARAEDAAGNSGTSATISVTVDNTATPPSGDVVLYAADASNVSGAWKLEQDPAAAAGWVVRHPNAGAARVDAPLASPANYVELTFQAEANVPYHLWVRAKSQNEHWSNDSVWVQFSGATTYKIGTTSATMVNLEDCSGCGTSGWGWQDNGYGTGVSGPHIFFTSSGTQTIRLQTREDGMFIDQIVLSPQTYLTTSPGALKDDSTIVQK